MRGVLGYAALLTVVVAAVIWFRTSDQDLSAPSATTLPDVRVHGLHVEAAGGRPAFSAVSATPRAGAGPLTLGGRREGLDLDQVVVALAEGCEMRASRGWFVGGTLRLEGRVLVERAGHRVLDTGVAEWNGAELHFPELVVFTTPHGRHTAVDLKLTLAELLDRLR